MMDSPDVVGTGKDVEVPDVRGSGPRGSYAVGGDRASRHFFEGFRDGGLVFRVALEGDGDVWTKVASSRGGGVRASDLELRLDVELGALKCVGRGERGARKLARDEQKSVNGEGCVVGECT